MTLIGKVMDKVMGRGLYKAYVGDKLISGCGECRHNLEEHNPIPFMKDIPVHRCSDNFELDGTHKIIIDPLSVPAWCNFKIIDVGEKK